MTILEKADFDKMWISLPEEIKRKRLKNAHNFLKYAYSRQVGLLKKMELNKEVNNAYFVYVFKAVENYWLNVNVAFLMGKKDSLKNYTFYPARAIIETYLRFSYFSDLPDNERDLVSDKDLLRIYRMLHKRALRGGDILEAKKIKNTYDKIRGNSNIKEIEQVSKGELDPFPDIKTLIEKSKIRDAKNYYMIYEYLCEATHGKTVSVIIRNQSDEFQEYRRSIMLIIDASKNMLVLVDDNFCNSELKNIILDSIKKADEAIMKTLTKKEKIYINNN